MPQLLSDRWNGHPGGDEDRRTVVSEIVDAEGGNACAPLGCLDLGVPRAVADGPAALVEQQSVGYVRRIDRQESCKGLSQVLCQTDRPHRGRRLEVPQREETVLAWYQLPATS